MYEIITRRKAFVSDWSVREYGLSQQTFSIPTISFHCETSETFFHEIMTETLHREWSRRPSIRELYFDVKSFGESLNVGFEGMYTGRVMTHGGNRPSAKSSIALTTEQTCPTPGPYGFPGVESFKLYELSEYSVRGEDVDVYDLSGTQHIWKKPADILESDVDAYLHDLKGEAVRLRIPTSSTDFLDGAIDALHHTSFNFEEAKRLMSIVTPDMLWNPTFSLGEVERFESGVQKFGPNLHQIANEVRTKGTAECVRFYYMWKNLPRARELLGK